MSEVAGRRFFVIVQTTFGLHKREAELATVDTVATIHSPPGKGSAEVADFSNPKLAWTNARPGSSGITNDPLKLIVSL